MKKISSVILLFCLSLGTALHAQGIVFEPQGAPLQQALAKAKKENKLVFVDVYTVWCGPCKAVARDVFPQQAVGDYYNKNFVNFKLDAEKGEGVVLAKKYGVNSYPTFLYLDAEGKVVHKFSGTRPAEGFITEAKRIVATAKYGGWDKMKADFGSGANNDAEFLQAFYDMTDADVKPAALNRWLMSLTDKQLFDETMYETIAKITLFDYPLFNRLIEGRVKMGKKSFEYDLTYTVEVQKQLSKFLAQSIDDNDEALFKQLLELKTKFEALPELQEIDLNLRKDVGLFTVSQPFLRLLFDARNRVNADRFPAQMTAYMDKFMTDFPAENYPDKFFGLIQITKTNKDLADAIGPDLMKSVPYISVYMIDELIRYYWYLSPSDDATKARCAKWLNYLCAINPYNADAPLRAASFLVRLGYKNDAAANLQKAIDGQKRIESDDVKLMRQLTHKLSEVEKGKD